MLAHCIARKGWRTLLSLGLLSALPLAERSAWGSEPLADAALVAARVDELVSRHWSSAGIDPAHLSDDSTFLRRVTLDLVGRTPTAAEARAYFEDRSPDKRSRAIRQLIESPEHALHLGNVLDELIQGRYAGDREFIGYLRRSVQQRRSWDRLFSELLLGPWDSDDAKPASRYIARRIKDLDALTSDTSRVFFGVEVACAKCHDHPLVHDWKQDHYYGMASFFNRTFEFGKERLVAEKDSEEVSFVDTEGNKHTARLMFLSGQVIYEPKLVVDPKLKDLKERYRKENRHLPPSFSRREQLVRVALDEKQFFSRAIVNHLWAYFLGRGLVHPVDQMHSENPPSLPGVLEYLADDLAAHGYDLTGTVAAIVSSRAYQLSSTWSSAAEPPDPAHFALAQIRPLTPEQFALSLLVAAGDESLAHAVEPEARADRHRELENRARALTEQLDPRTYNFQASAGEALFMSNNDAVQQLLHPAGGNLVERLAMIRDDEELVTTAAWAVLSRAADAEERAYLAGWTRERAGDRAAVCGQLVWALLTSAEFRFNH
jgi:hypothetical protein